MQCSVGHYGIKRYVPWTLLDLLQSLPFMGEAEQVGGLEEATLLFEGEGAVVESAAHADTVTMGIEAEQRHHDKVQVRWPDEIACGRYRFFDTETVEAHRFARLPAAENQPAADKRMQHWQADGLSERQRCFHQGQRAQL